MKGVMETFGLIIGFLVLRLGGIALWLFKIFLGLCVVLGAATQILKGFPTVRIEQLVWYEAVWWGAFDLGNNVVENWMAATVLRLFFWVMSAKGEITRIASDVRQMKIGLIATMNYLEIEVQTDAMKQLKNQGFFQMLKTSFGINLWAAMLGDRKNLTDDALTARSVRHGSNVTLREDIAVSSTIEH